jgi:cellulose synthase/poly-beta-1,6-N-acetylglucosamine synthase-like glycosyltransferase
MDILTIIYLIYTFISFYFLFFFLLIYIPNRKEISSFPKYDKVYSLSMIVPCYNGESDIRGTIEALLDSDYPGLEKIIVVDDCSTDGSWKIIQGFAKKHKKILAVQTPKNTGNAAGAKNYGAKFVDTELIGFSDDDSYPEKNGISKMVGFFSNPKVGAVASSVFVKKRKSFLEQVQSIEYKMIAFSRRLLGFVEAIYVTPGPLAIYRKEAFVKVGGFDVENMTEDIEITWAIVRAGYKVEMASAARVYSVVPNTVKAWIKQRIRWNIGGVQSINKYKKNFGSSKAGMLGKFILPFFLFNWILGVFGITVLFYRLIRTLIVRYLSTTYSIEYQTAILNLKDVNLTPSILVFFGIAAVIMNFFIIVVALSHSREKEYKNPNIIAVSFYFVFYLLTYPFILLTSLYKFFRGKYSW